MRLTADDERGRIIEWIKQIQVAIEPKTGATGKMDRTRQRYEDDEDVDETQLAMERHADQLQEEAAYNDCLRGLHTDISETLDEVEDMDMDELRDTANEIFDRGLSSRVERLAHRLETRTGAKAKGLREALTTLQSLQNDFLRELSDWKL